jgi:hypothetical protein
MTTHLLAVGALLALAQARAIVTNQCTHAVYLWSVPNNGTASDANNLQINPGGRYEERWHYGSSKNPGISLKISTQPGGVYTGMDELDFAYSIDPNNESLVWVDLSSVRGQGFNETAFHYGESLTTSSTELSPVSCSVSDEVELVLCATARTTSAKDDASLDAISKCYDYLHVDRSTSTASSAKSQSKTTSAQVKTHKRTTTALSPAQTAKKDTQQAKVTVHLPPKHTIAPFDQASLNRALQRASHRGFKVPAADISCMPKVTYPELRYPTRSNSRATKHGNVTMIEPIRVCILPFCEPMLPDVDCAWAEEELDKEFKPDFDFTKDDDVCSDWTVRPGKTSLGERVREYVEPFCNEYLPGIDCKELSDGIEVLMDLFVEWVGDENMCLVRTILKAAAEGQLGEYVEPLCKAVLPADDCTDLLEGLGDLHEDLADLVNEEYKCSSV